jgi:hypothetical protein
MSHPSVSRVSRSVKEQAPDAAVPCGAIQDCLARLANYEKRNDLFSCEVLVQTDKDDHFNTLEFYSRSTSLVQFLTALKGPQPFIAFLRTAIRKEPALNEHFEIHGFAGLERAWESFAFGNPRKSEPRWTRSPAAPRSIVSALRRESGRTHLRRYPLKRGFRKLDKL